MKVGMRRSAGSLFSFGLNILNAAIGTDMMQTVFWNPQGFVASRWSLIQFDVVTSTVAFVLGFLVQWVWKPDTAKWVWTAGLIWFVLGAITSTGDVGSFLPELVPRESAFDVRNSDDENIVMHWITLTMPLLRTIFYSLGAFTCSALRHRNSSREKPLTQGSVDL